MVMKVFICVAVLVVVIYVISKLSGLYPDNIELSIGSIIRLRIHNKEKRPQGGFNTKRSSFKKLN